MKLIKTIFLLIFIFIVVMSFTLPEKAKADAYSGNLQISAKVKSSFKIGKSLKLTVYVKDETGKKVKDANINVQVTQLISSTESVNKGNYYGITKKRGTCKFKIDTKSMLPNYACKIDITAVYGLTSNSIYVLVYPQGKYGVPLQAHLTADVTQIMRGQSITLTVVGDNLLPNNYITRTIWERDCITSSGKHNKKVFADTSSTTVKWDSIIAPAGTNQVSFKVLVQDNLGRETTLNLSLPFIESSPLKVILTADKSEVTRGTWESVRVTARLENVIPGEFLPWDICDYHWVTDYGVIRSDGLFILKERYSEGYGPGYSSTIEWYPSANTPADINKATITVTVLGGYDRTATGSFTITIK
jgi:hypothetical protein